MKEPAKALQMMKVVIVGIVTMLCCVALLTAVACIPTAMIRKQSVISAEFFAEREPFRVLFGPFINAMQDNYSDTVLLDIIYCVDPSHPFRSAVLAEYVQGAEEEAYRGYLSAVSGDAVPNMEYGRYWHGTSVILRPLLIFLPIAGIRVLFGIAGSVLQGVVVILLCRCKKNSLAICWLLALLLIEPWMFFTSLEYSTAFVTASAASAAILLKKEKATDAETMPFFAAVGVITCFVDFLTTETMTFTLPMLLVLAARTGDKRPYGTERTKEITIKSGCLSVIKNGLCWLAGYTVMFLLKILLLARVAGTDTAKASLSEGLFRISGEVGQANISIAPPVDAFSRLSGAVWHNLACLYPMTTGEMKALWAWIPTLVIVGAGLVAVYLLHERIAHHVFLPMGMLAVLPYLRFLVLSNHSYIHFFITYRAQMVTLVVFFLFVYENGIRQLIKTKH